jgi:hypothetical protein
MTFKTTRLRRALILGLGLASVLVGACLRPPAAVHELTYPPDFSYLPAEELRSAMWLLAAEISRLDELLRAEPNLSGDAALHNQESIQKVLRRLSAAVKSIDVPGRATQHPGLNRNLTRFKARVERAQRAAGRSPPSYFQAAALSGSCFLCHGAGEERTRL